MTLFQRSLYGEEPTFTNLFRMLDDFAAYRDDSHSNGRIHSRQARHRTFSPRFDVRETDAAYELYGEFAGMTRDNISIEFTEPQTLVVRGRVERSYSSGTPPAALVEGTETTDAITEAGENGHKANDHQATVSDEETEVAKENGETPAVLTPAASTPKEEAPKRQERYWHQERSVGDFQRTFCFSSRVDQDAVTASLDNGVLHVTVPKAAKPANRRIDIN